MQTGYNQRNNVLIIGHICASHTHICKNVDLCQSYSHLLNLATLNNVASNLAAWWTVPRACHSLVEQREVLLGGLCLTSQTTSHTVSATHLSSSTCGMKSCLIASVLLVGPLAITISATHLLSSMYGIKSC